MRSEWRAAQIPLTAQTAAAEPAPAMTIYSAHDTTVFSLLAALGATRTAPLPKFSAHVVLELWQHPSLPHSRATMHDTFTVRIRYGANRLQGLRWCPDGECSLGRFIEGTQGGSMSPKLCVRTNAGSSQNREDKACCSPERAPSHAGRST